MRLSGYSGTICDVQQISERDTPPGAWEKRWWHWGGSGASELNGYFPNADSLYVCCYDEVGYERRLGDFVDNNRNIDEADWYFVLKDVVAISRPYL